MTTVAGCRYGKKFIANDRRDLLRTSILGHPLCEGESNSQILGREDFRLIVDELAAGLPIRQLDICLPS